MKILYIFKSKPYKTSEDNDGVLENFNVAFLNKILYNYQYNGIQGSHFTGWGKMIQVRHEFI